MSRYLQKIGLTTLAAALVSLSASAQDEFVAARIPTVLLENAHAVIRRHETVFTVNDPGEATTYERLVVTVLDEQGDSYAQRVLPYNKLAKVDNLEGALYDAYGKSIKKLRKADVDDYGSFMDYNLYDDQRFKAARFPKQPAYPYTVEYISQVISRNLMFYENWRPQPSASTAVEQSSFTVRMPEEMPLRYKEYNLTRPVAITSEKAGSRYERIYSWQMTNLAARESEPFAPPAYEQFPMVYTAPAVFEVQAYQGKIASWNDLGTFYLSLNRGRDAIPETLKQQVIQQTAGEKTTVGKVQKLYEFLQQHTRYVSIQLGLGGWQTIEAGQVAAKNYGDCKALTNYAKAMLKAVGVPAYEALVRAGDDEADIRTDFPSFQFNHVILCVPDGRDTLWLECTSQHNAMGYAGTFTGNRHVLLLQPTGSKLVKTPVYRPTDNRQQCRALITLTEQGDAVADAVTRYAGLQQESRADLMHTGSHDEQRTWLIKHTRIPSFELTDFGLAETKARIPSVTETLKLTIRRWATPSGTRLFLPLNLLSALPPLSPATKPREAPLDLDANYDFEDTDTLTYQLPDGYTPEFMVAPLLIDSKFGQYAVQTTVAANRVTYIRRLTMHRGRYPAEAYTEWVEFRKKIAKADKGQLVFVKK